MDDFEEKLTYNLTNFYDSYAKEFLAIQDRIRNLIGVDHHPLSDGWYKEHFLMNFLKKILPKHLGIGTGFFLQSIQLSSGSRATVASSEIDILIFDANYPVILREDDFVIVPAKSVRAIIEVKSKAVHHAGGDTTPGSHNYETLKKAVAKLNKNGILLYMLSGYQRASIAYNQGDRQIDWLNTNPVIALFSYDCYLNPHDPKGSVLRIGNKLEESLEASYFNPSELNHHWFDFQNTNSFMVNLINLGTNVFIRSEQIENYNKHNFGVYYFEQDLAPSYFIGNLIMSLIKQQNNGNISQQEVMNFFPREKTNDERVLSFDFNTDRVEIMRNHLGDKLKEIIEKITEDPLKSEIIEEFEHQNFTDFYLNMKQNYSNKYITLFRDPYFQIFFNLYTLSRINPWEL